MTDKEERAYLNGRQQAWERMLGMCLQELPVDESKRQGWVLERAEAIRALRSVCEQFGDNDWPDNLNLSDIIEKHLTRHLEENA